MRTPQGKGSKEWASMTPADFGHKTGPQIALFGLGELFGQERAPEPAEPAPAFDLEALGEPDVKPAGPESDWCGWYCANPGCECKFHTARRPQMSKR